MCSEKVETRRFPGEEPRRCAFDRSKERWLLLVLLPPLLGGGRGEAYAQRKTRGRDPFLADAALAETEDTTKSERPEELDWGDAEDEDLEPLQGDPTVAEGPTTPDREDPESDSENLTAMWEELEALESPEIRYPSQESLQEGLQEGKGLAGISYAFQAIPREGSWLPELSLAGGITFVTSRRERTTRLPIEEGAFSLPLPKGWEGGKKRFAIFLRFRWPFPERLAENYRMVNTEKERAWSDLRIAALERIAELRAEGTLAHAPEKGEKASRHQAWERIIAAESRAARIELLERIARFPPAATPPYGDTTEGTAEGTAPKRSNERP